MDRDRSGSRHRGGNKHGKHSHHRHRDRDRSFFYLGLGLPYGAYGPWYNPIWSRPWLYSSGFGIGYTSSRFGFYYGAGYSGYSQAWPYYDYDPYCDPLVVSNPVYIVEQSPQIVSVPPATSADNFAVEIPSDPPADTQPQDPGIASPPAQPVPDDYQVDESADEFIRLGEDEFYNRRYDRAIKALRHALLEDPRNGVVILMLAQSLFETDNYVEAAGAVQQALSLLPEEKWGVVIENYKELYSDSKDYVEQLKALELAVKKEPESAALRFLVAYHYGFLGYPKHSVRELDKLLELAPNDLIGKKLHEVMTKKQAEKDKATPPVGAAATPPAQTPPPPPPGEKL